MEDNLFTLNIKDNPLRGTGPESNDNQEGSTLPSHLKGGGLPPSGGNLTDLIIRVNSIEKDIDVIKGGVDTFSWKEFVALSAVIIVVGVAVLGGGLYIIEQNEVANQKLFTVGKESFGKQIDHLNENISKIDDSIKSINENITKLSKTSNETNTQLHVIKNDLKHYNNNSK